MLSCLLNKNLGKIYISSSSCDVLAANFAYHSHCFGRSIFSFSTFTIYWLVSFFYIKENTQLPVNTAGVYLIKVSCDVFMYVISQTLWSVSACNKQCKDRMGPLTASCLVMSTVRLIGLKGLWLRFLDPNHSSLWSNLLSHPIHFRHLICKICMIGFPSLQLGK